MDPTANWGEQVDLAIAIQADVERGLIPDPQDAERLAELVLALDGWLQNGGALPQGWAR